MNVYRRHETKYKKGLGSAIAPQRVRAERGRQTHFCAILCAEFVKSFTHVHKMPIQYGRNSEAPTPGPP